MFLASNGYDVRVVLTGEFPSAVENPALGGPHLVARRVGYLYPVRHEWLLAVALVLLGEFLVALSQGLAVVVVEGRVPAVVLGDVFEPRVRSAHVSRYVGLDRHVRLVGQVRVFRYARLGREFHTVRREVVVFRVPRDRMT